MEHKRKKDIEKIQQQLKSTPQNADLQAELKTATAHVENLEADLDSERRARLTKAQQVCAELLELSEGADANETLFKSSKILGTLLLCSPGTGKGLVDTHQRLKPAYKAVLSLRLMDMLLESGKVTHSYILKYWQAEQRYAKEDFFACGFKQAVLLPLMLCAIYQDVGMRHPKVIKLLYGDGEKDPSRILEKGERQTLLKLNYQYTQQYLLEGLGMQRYRGNSKEQRDEYVAVEKSRIAFQKSLLKDANMQSSNLGEMIKVPQIYSSVVLSTKPDFKYSDLPKATLLIEQMANKKLISQVSSSTFVELVGQFPQGYGISFIPKDQASSRGFEYAIVVGLRPQHKQKPYCKIATKKQVFVSAGSNMTIEPSQNLHYAETRKKYSRMDEARLTEIMGALSHEFDANSEDNPIPHCWNPHDYFINNGMQNLWALADVQSN